MTSVFRIILVLGVCVHAAAPTRAARGGATELPSPFLGQPLPGDTAVLFAPGLVSVEGRYEYGMGFSPDGRELLFTAHEPEGAAVLRRFAATDTGWVGPTEVRLAAGQKAEEMEAFFTPDGHRIYFAAYDEGMDVRIWAVDRSGDAWTRPRQLGPPLSAQPAFFPTTTTAGAIYYTNLAERGIFRATLAGDSVLTAENTGLKANHAFIAPDESFVLLDARPGGKGTKPDLFVAFRQADGSWSRRHDLGPGVNTEYSETCPSLSPDGRFIFFSRYDEAGGIANIYWVSSEVIRAARE